MKSLVFSYKKKKLILSNDLIVIAEMKDNLFSSWNIMYILVIKIVIKLIIILHF